ncbi:MAG: hypothetical protein SV686_12635 [Thermodesulfobacteriota bacterium]|nr:hypothetical protein [Thermodesulfobacteriota bacterium]
MTISETNLVNMYPYLFANLFYLFVLFSGLLFVAKGNRRLVYLAGLVNIPCFPFLIYFEEIYWYPKRFGGWVLGIEDAICSFVVGAMVVLVVLLFFDYRSSRDTSLSRILSRYFSFCTISVILFFLFLLAFGANPMTALIFSNAIVFSLLLLLRKDLLTVALLGMIGYGVAHFVLMKIGFWLLPGFLESWNLGTLWGHTLFNVPLGEITWAFFYGAFWPVFIAHVFDLRVRFRIFPIAAAG